MANANVVTWVGRSIMNNRLNGNGTAPVNLGWGISSGDTGSAFSDVNLFQAANTESRVAATVSFAQANQLADTIVFIGTLTANGAKGVTEIGLFDTLTALSPQCQVNSTAANATTTTIGLTGAGAAGMPTSGNYYAQWDNEVILVTGGQNSNTLTVTRGVLGSTAASHLASSWLTAGGDGGAHTMNTATSSETWGPTGANGGSMATHADFAVINLSNNDSIQFTLKIQLS